MSREEAIKDLKLFIEYANNSNNFREDYEQENCKICANSIKVILSELKSSIPIQKIRDKICELDKECKELKEKFGKQDGDYLYTKGAINYLEELLKEESEV